MDISKYLDLFISETREHIRLLNENLLILEKSPDNTEALNQIFRSFHTIKGMAATMAYDTLATLAHRLEDLLSEIRKGKLNINQIIINYFLSVIDRFEQSLELLKSGQGIPPVQDLFDKCDALLKGKPIAEEEVSTRMLGKLEEVRIKMVQLDQLVNLLSEFILARNRLTRIQAALKNPELVTVAESISRLIDEFGDEVMRMRMLPLSSIFSLFPRWFRDQAQQLDRKVQLVIEGGDIEIDRSIIDSLKEPILHLLRNALDHGMRGDQEKEGMTIKLAAYREKDFIKIVVEDNGQGIDIDEIKKVAINQKLLAPGDIKKMGDGEILKIIFHPEFSTKSEVTGLSGRGVGLNVVKKAVEAMRGDIEIETEKSIGTKFILLLPIRLATIKVMVFALGDELYSIPLVNIIETFNLSEAEIKKVHHHEMIIFRNESLPVIRLKKTLGLPTNGQKRHVAIVTVAADEKRVFLVDNILSQEEMIVKPLDPMLKRKEFSGVSIYSDGRPILILEPKSLE